MRKGETSRMWSGWLRSFWVFGWHQWELCLQEILSVGLSSCPSSAHLSGFHWVASSDSLGASVEQEVPAGALYLVSSLGF